MLCWYWVCGSADKVGQERPLVCPRLYFTPDYWCWWCHLNTWLTSVHSYWLLHFLFPPLSFTCRHIVHTHMHMGMHTYTQSQRHVLYVVWFMVSCCDVILQTFRAACFSRLWRLKHRKLVRNFKSCPQAERLDSGITCTMIHSCPDCCSHSVLFDTDLKQ